jgi:hypothetical protein
MGRKKHEKGRARMINVEVAPGNQVRLDRYLEAYNHATSRSTPKLTYTDLVNEALDLFLGRWKLSRRLR